MSCPGTDTPCSGNGICGVDPDDSRQARCECQPGYLGQDCSSKCPVGINDNGAAADCSGHGECILATKTNAQWAQCLCQKGYTGNACDAAVGQMSIAAQQEPAPFASWAVVLVVILSGMSILAAYLCYIAERRRQQLKGYRVSTEEDIGKLVD